MKKYLCIFILFCFYACHECTCPTVYSENYTAARWQQIRIGMDTNEVKYILGEPIFKNEVSQHPDYARWYRGLFYSWDYSNDSIGGEIFPCECWKTKKLYFDSAWVVKKIRDAITYD